MDYKQPPPALTLKEFYALPTGTRLEVYVQGTGVWVPATVRCGTFSTSVVPDDDQLAPWHKVVFLDYDEQVELERLLRLVRRPHPKGLILEPSDYRDLLERFSFDLVEMFRARATQDGVPSPTKETVSASLRHLLGSGFTSDLWYILKVVIDDQFKPQVEDDFLMQILAELEGE